MKTQIEFNGLYFSEGTPEKVMQILSNNLHNKKRLRFWYGDLQTGKSWNEENDICGYIGCTTGKRTPILVNNSRSMGGGMILTDCIVKIVNITDGYQVYKHENFSQSLFTSKGVQVFSDGQIYANCKSETNAKRLCDFMNGNRNNK